MPLGRGCFLGPGGEVIEVFEHLAAVEADPGRFGLAPGDVEPLDDAERRDRESRRRRVLAMVLRNGFVRVRFAPRRDVCEYWAGTPEEDARRRRIIQAFLGKQGSRAIVKRLR